MTFVATIFNRITLGLLHLVFDIMSDSKAHSKRAVQNLLERIPKISKNKRSRQLSPSRPEDALLDKQLKSKRTDIRTSSEKGTLSKEQEKKMDNKRVKREIKLKPLFGLQKKSQPQTAKATEALSLANLRVWFPKVKDEDWMRLRALDAHGRQAKGSRSKLATTDRTIESSAKKKLLMSGGNIVMFPPEEAVVEQHSNAPVEGGKNPAVSVLRRPVRKLGESQDEISRNFVESQDEIRRKLVESPDEISDTLGLRSEAGLLHPECFVEPARIQAEYAHPSPLPGVPSWMEEL